MNKYEPMCLTHLFSQSETRGFIHRKGVKSKGDKGVSTDKEEQRGKT